MKNTNIILAIFICLASVTAIPAPRSQSPNQTTESDATHQIKRLDDDVKEIRRDQLNYKIERDLLKEAYATNLKTVDVLITVALGVITIVGGVLGFLGVRNISLVRKEYNEDLEALRKLKAKFEEDLEQIKIKQTETKDQFTTLGNRIHVLELQEKASQFIDAKNYPRPLSYAEVGLTVLPDDPIFLTQKGLCHFKLRDYPLAIQAYELLSKTTNPDFASLAELYLIGHRLDDFDKLSATTPFFYKDPTIDAEFRNYIAALRAFINKDTKTLQRTIEEYVALGASGQSRRVGTWDFEDIRHAIQQYPDTSDKTLFLRYISVLTGQAPIESLKEPA
jgi:tetratricopeptide (TPR) repeat protein